MNRFKMISVLCLFAGVTIGFMTSSSYAFNDTFEISNYDRYNVSMEHDNKSVYNSNEPTIEWSFKPTANFYIFTYGDRQFVLKSSLNHSTNNDTTCEYSVSLMHPYSVHVSLSNESLNYCTPTDYWY